MDTRTESIQRCTRLFLFGVSLIQCAGAALGQVSFSVVPLFPGASQSTGYAVSGDGLVVLGQSGYYQGAERAFRMTDAHGVEDLGLIPGATFPQAYVSPFAVSPDGATVAGSVDGGFTLIEHAFRWTLEGGMVDLGVIDGSGQNDFSRAYGVSGDGSIVVGATADGAFIWTLAAGMQLVPGMSEATGITPDGSVIVGLQWDGVNSHAIRWTQAGGPEDLGLWSPTGVSDDGEKIVGNQQGAHARVWTRASGVVILPPPNNLPHSAYVTAISGDGSTIVGQIDNLAAVWQGLAPCIDLQAYLSASGIDLTGWNLQAAGAVSYDGSVIVGTGRLSGQYQGWVVRLHPTCSTADFNHDGDPATDQDIEDFFSCIAGNCCPTCYTADFNGDTDTATDADIEAFFRVLAGGGC